MLIKLGQSVKRFPLDEQRLGPLSRVLQLRSRTPHVGELESHVGWLNDGDDE